MLSNIGSCFSAGIKIAQCWLRHTWRSICDLRARACVLLRARVRVYQRLPR